MTSQSFVDFDTGAPAVTNRSAAKNAETSTLGELVPELTTRLEAMVETRKTESSGWMTNVQNGIRDKPVQLGLIAAAGGAVLGFILGRRGLCGR